MHINQFFNLLQTLRSYNRYCKACKLSAYTDRFSLPEGIRPWMENIRGIAPGGVVCVPVTGSDACHFPLLPLQSPAACSSHIPFCQPNKVHVPGCNLSCEEPSGRHPAGSVCSFSWYGQRSVPHRCVTTLSCWPETPGMRHPPWISGSTVSRTCQQIPVFVLHTRRFSLPSAVTLPSSAPTLRLSADTLGYLKSLPHPESVQGSIPIFRCGQFVQDKKCLFLLDAYTFFWILHM